MISWSLQPFLFGNFLFLLTPKRTCYCREEFQERFFMDLQKILFAYICMNHIFFDLMSSFSTKLMNFINVALPLNKLLVLNGYCWLIILYMVLSNWNSTCFSCHQILIDKSINYISRILVQRNREKLIRNETVQVVGSVKGRY